MGAFNRAILMRRVSTSRVNCVVESGKEIANFRIHEKFTTLVHVNVFGGARGRVLIEKMTEPFDRRGFGATCITVLHASKMVCNKDPSGLAIKTFIVFSTFRVSRFQTREAKVDGKTLVGLRSDPCGMVAWRGFSLFGLDASGASRKDTRFGSEFGDTIDSLMSIVKVRVAWVTKALVPKHTTRSILNCKNWYGRLEQWRQGRIERIVGVDVVVVVGVHIVVDVIVDVIAGIRTRGTMAVLGYSR